MDPATQQKQAPKRLKFGPEKAGADIRYRSGARGILCPRASQVFYA